MLQQGDLTALPQPAASFDVAIVDRMLVATADPVEALREVARLLTPGGQVLLVEDYDELDAARAGRQPVRPVAAVARGGGPCAARGCIRVDLDGRHLLLAVATVRSVAAAA